MPTQPASRRLLHREKPDGLTVEFTLGKTDTLAARSQELIPFDAPGAHEGWLKSAIERGGLSSTVIQVDGEEVGLMTWAVIESPDSSLKELLISTAHAESKKLPFLPIMLTVARKLAANNGCDYIRFHTVRKGLVKQAISLGFYVSEIVMRHKVNSNL